MWPPHVFQGPNDPALLEQNAQIADRDAVFASLKVYDDARAECYRRSGTTPMGSSRGWPYDR